MPGKGLEPPAAFFSPGRGDEMVLQISYWKVDYSMPDLPPAASPTLTCTPGDT